MTLVVAAGASFYGLRWGLAGVAWAIVSAHILSATCLYALAHRAVKARLRDLTNAIGPAVILNALLAAALTLLHHIVADLRAVSPSLYIVAMAMFGGLVYALAFLFLPLEALRSEADRWKKAVTSRLMRPK